MDDRKTYLNTDELQADDEMSPLPALNPPRRQAEQSGDASQKGFDDSERTPPRAATSE